MQLVLQLLIVFWLIIVGLFLGGYSTAAWIVLGVLMYVGLVIGGIFLAGSKRR